MQWGRAALGQPTFNFTFYENPRNSLKKRDFPVTLQKCKKNWHVIQHSRNMCIIMHSKLASKPVFMGSKIFFDSSKIFKPSNANLSQLNEGKLSSSKTKRE